MVDRLIKIRILIVWNLLGLTLIANNLLSQDYFIKTYQYEDKFNTAFNGVVNQNDTLIVSGLSYDCIDSFSCFQGFYIAKFDTLGNVLSDTVILAHEDDIVAENTPILVITKDNGYMLVGELLGSGNGYLVKLNNNFQVDFFKEYLENGTGVLSVRNRGILYLNGYYYILSIKQHSNFQRITHLIKIDSLGNLVWDKPFLREGDSSVKFKASQGGNLLVYGQRSRRDLENEVEIKQWIFFADTSGGVIREHETEWLKNRFSGYFDVLEIETGFILSMSNYIYDPPSIPFPKNQIVLLKTDDEFNPEWSTMYGDTTTVNFVANIIPLGSGEFIATGNYSPYPDNLPNSAITTLTIKFDEFGNIKWDRLDSVSYEPTYGSKNVTAESIILNSGSIITVGYTDVFVPTQSSLGFLVKLDKNGCIIPNCHLNVSTDENILTTRAVIMYPNPVKDILSIKLRTPINLSEIVNIKILNTIGLIVLRDKFHLVNNEFQINFQSLPSGAYMVQLNFENKTSCFKVIKL